MFWIYDNYHLIGGNLLIFNLDLKVAESTPSARARERRFSTTYTVPGLPTFPAPM